MIKLICDNCGKEYLSKCNKQYIHCFCSKYCEANFRKGKPKNNKKLNEIIIQKDFAIIKIKNNKLGDLECLIDIEDIEKVKNYFWNIRQDKRHPKCTLYVESRKIKKRVHLHRLIMDCPDNMVVDHINGNGLDNRKTNLKICSQLTNTRNNHFAKNITYVKRDNIYYVSFYINGKVKYLCYTRNIEEANYYAKLGRNLLKENKIEKLLNMPCKRIDLFANNKSGVKGISCLKNGKYQVRYKSKYIGTVNNIEDGKKLLKNYIDHLQHNF